MPFPSYTVRRTFWPLWAWTANLQDGSVERGLAVSKATAREAARTRVRNAAVLKTLALASE